MDKDTLWQLLRQLTEHGLKGRSLIEQFVESNNN